MSNPWRPSSLELKDIADIHPTSMTKALMYAEKYWPRQILEYPVVHMSVEGRSLYFVSEPTCARALLSLGDTKLPKAYIYERVIGYSTGRKSISASSGKQSKKLRKGFSPIFKKSIVSSLVPIFNHYTEEATKAWVEGERLDISLVLQGITVRGICRIMYGEKDCAASLPSIVEEIIPPLHASLMKGNLRKQTQQFDELAQGLLRNPPTDPLLPGNPLIGSATSTIPLSDEEKLHNLRVFIAAGSETTALTLTWCLWILGSRPDIQEQVHAELDAQLGDRPVTIELLQKLPFLSQVINETLRLYPTAPITVREAKSDIDVEGYHFENRSVVAINFYGLHRNPSIWHNADKFIPHRFAEYDNKTEKFSAFLPFGFGPHMCIGAELGRAETMTILANMLRNYRFAAETDELPPRMRITLRPQQEVWLKVSRR